MVGGDAEPLSRATPVLRAIGPNIFHVGPVGAGNTVKAINNMMASVNACAMMEGLALGVKAGLDPMTIYEVVKASSGGSKALERIPKALIPRDFRAGLQGGAHEQRSRHVQHDRQGAARPGQLLERGAALPAGGAGSRPR